MKNEDQEFTIIGFYSDSKQRFADSYMASCADMAEAMAEKEHDTLVVCGVIAGRHNCVDENSTVDI